MATLIDQQTGEVAFHVSPLTDSISTASVSRHNQYMIFLVQSGTLTMTVDFVTQTISSKALLCLSPYQPYRLTAMSGVTGWLLFFHPDFFCTYKHQHEIALEGALFHTNYQLPFFGIDDDTPLDITIRQIHAELTNEDLAQHELLIAYLKIYLIQILRLKTRHDNVAVSSTDLPPVIVRLKEHIEREYRRKHSPADYAQLVHMSLNALGKLAKKHFDRPLSVLIANRIMTEAKRELYLTAKTIKEIAHWLGYADEYYFSRFFKRHAGISPQQYRHTVGFARAGVL